MSACLVQEDGFSKWLSWWGWGEEEGENSAEKGGADVICSEAKLNNPRNTLLDKSLPVKEGWRQRRNVKQVIDLSLLVLQWPSHLVAAIHSDS